MLDLIAVAVCIYMNIIIHVVQSYLRGEKLILFRFYCFVCSVVKICDSVSTHELVCASESYRHKVIDYLFLKVELCRVCSCFGELWAHVNGMTTPYKYFTLERSYN